MKKSLLITIIIIILILGTIAVIFIINSSETGDEKKMDTTQLTIQPTTPEPKKKKLPPMEKPSLSGLDETGEYGKMLYNYVAVSDVHIREQDSKDRKSVEKFQNFVDNINDFKPDFVLCAGDIGRDYTKFEFETFKEGRLKTGIPWYAITGNHDVKYDEEQWFELTGSYLNYTLDLNGDIYIFVSLDSNEYGEVDALPYEDSMQWLEEQLKKYKGHRIFLTMHYPPTGYSGLRPEQIYGFEETCTQDEEIIRMVRETGNVIMFTGHSHLMYEVEAEYPDVNVYSFEEENCHLVHIPSLGWPIDKVGEYPDSQSEFFFVNVYEDAVVLEGARNNYLEKTITKDENYVYILKVKIS